jgi:hypothetical protein
MIKSVKRLCFSRVPLEGYFKYKDEFFVYPWIKEPQVPYFTADHPIIIEMSLDNLEIVNIENEWSEVSQYADEKSLEIMRLLSTLSTYRFYHYHVSNAWVIPYEDHTFQKPSVFGQLSYRAKNIEEKVDVNDFDEINLIEHSEYFTQYAPRLSTKPVSFPDSMSYLLDLYYSFENEKKTYFNSASTLFVNGVELKDHYLTLSLAVIALVTSLETLISFEHLGETIKQCVECKRPIYNVHQKFLEFYVKYTSNEKNRKFARYLYGLRSGISHSGKLFSSDKQSGFELMDSVKLENIIKNIRVVIINWMIKIGE